MSEYDTGSDTGTIAKDQVKVKEPKMFRVILLNDDYTTMDFVVSVLESIFQKSPAEAVRIMLNVHKIGKGVCGTYARQVAEAKVDLVHKRAHASRFPLKCEMEEV